MSCKVYCLQQQRNVRFTLRSQDVSALVRMVLFLENISADFVSIAFISDTKTKALHEQYFQDSSSTDCMTFPIDSPKTCGPKYLGEILICPETALRIAQSNEDLFFQELTLYIVHGLLHLLGYEDEHPSKKRIMKRKERFLMKYLQQSGLLLSGKLHL